MIFKTFWWTLGIVLMGLLCAFFLTTELTEYCSKQLSVCLMHHMHSPLWEKISGGMMCLFNNVWCVLSSLFI